MAKKTVKQDDDFQGSPAPELDKADLGALHRLAAAGDEGGDDDWEPGSNEPAPEEKKKPGRPKKDKEPPKPRGPRKVLEIRAGSIKKDIFCHFAYDHNLAPTITNEIEVKSEIPVHDDMRIAFKQLAPHLAMIFGGLTLEEVNDIDMEDQEDENLIRLRKFEVSSFYLDKYDELEAVILIGTEELPTGIAFLTTPAIQFVNSKYEHAAALRASIDDALFEIEEYLHGRKRADDKQLKMAL